VVAGPNGGNAIADLVDDTGTLVARDSRQGADGHVTIEEVDIAVTDSCGAEAHFDFAWSGRVEHYLLDNERLADTVE
jgi:hypothetical protein